MKSKGKIFCLVVLSLVAIHSLFFRAPSESQMIANFHAHKAQFEQIRAMIAQDKNVKAIGTDWADASGNQNRLALYRSLMHQVGISTIVVDARNNRIRLSAFGGGFADTTWSIGYAWCKDAPTPLVPSAYDQRPGRDKIHYSRIEGLWYLYQRR